MTTFLNWRVLTHRLEAADAVAQISVAVAVEQAVYSFVWQPETCRSLRALKSSSALQPTPPPGEAQLRLVRRASNGAGTQRTAYGASSTSAAAAAAVSSMRLKVFRVPFSTFDEPDPRTPNGKIVLAPPASHAAEFSCSQNPYVPDTTRPLLLQPATTLKEGVLLALLDGERIFIYRPASSEWLPPLRLADHPLRVRQFLLLKGAQLFVQYVDGGGGWPQFGLVDLERSEVVVPLALPALPRSHGVTFFVSEHAEAVSAVLDRWPRCEREVWSVPLAEVVGDADSCSCWQLPADALELHYQQWVPFGTRWVLGVEGAAWLYRDSNRLIPHQHAGGTGHQPGPGGGGGGGVILDKVTGRVSHLPQTALRPDLKPVASPSFYVPVNLTPALRTALPAVLFERPGHLALHLYRGAYARRSPRDLDLTLDLLTTNLSHEAAALVFSYLLD